RIVTRCRPILAPGCESSNIIRKLPSAAVVAVDARPLDWPDTDSGSNKTSAVAGCPQNVTSPRTSASDSSRCPHPISRHNAKLPQTVKDVAVNGSEEFFMPPETA